MRVIKFWIQWSLHITNTCVGPMSLSFVERCPLYGGGIFFHTVFQDENICTSFEGVRHIEVSINGGSCVL